jgi:uncharacterized membrane protein (DUF4010 family)
MAIVIIPETLDTAARLAVAGLVGLAVGIERERSGHAVGPSRDFAGVRTFFLMGMLGGLGGLLVASEAALASMALVAGGVLLTVGAYVVTARRDTADAVDGTTEVAALVVLALGLLAGGGALRLTAALAALVVLALAEKELLHRWVQRLDPLEMRAALHFAVLALVVLPLFPVVIASPVGDITPRATWVLALVISGLNFAGHLARRIVGRERGYAVTGALGGLVSSTAVTWGFARGSRDDAALRPGYAAGVIAASTVLFPRVCAVVLLLNPRVGLAVLPYLAAPFLIGAAWAWWAARAPSSAQAPSDEAPRNPLRLGAALQMAVAFQLVLLLMAFVRTQFGDAGVYTTAALFGLTDVDAISVSMTRVAQDDFTPVAARAIVVAVASNTAAKALIAATVGRGVFRLRAAAALAAMLAALVAALLLISDTPRSRHSDVGRSYHQSLDDPQGQLRLHRGFRRRGPAAHDHRRDAAAGAQRGTESVAHAGHGDCRLPGRQPALLPAEVAGGRGGNAHGRAGHEWTQCQGPASRAEGRRAAGAIGPRRPTRTDGALPGVVRGLLRRERGRARRHRHGRARRHAAGVAG